MGIINIDVDKLKPIINCNIIIAEYIGWERYEEDGKSWWKLPDQIRCMHKQAESFDFHNSWDKMEPAILKAGNTEYTNHDQYKAWEKLNEGLQRFNKQMVHEALTAYILVVKKWSVIKSIKGV